MNYLSFFFFNDTPTTKIYTLSLHDALPISGPPGSTTARLAFWADSRPKRQDRKSTRLNSSHVEISYAVFCLKKKKIVRELNTTRYTCSRIAWAIPNLMQRYASVSMAV